MDHQMKNQMKPNVTIYLSGNSKNELNVIVPTELVQKS
jgi:hypothetical protein